MSDLQARFDQAQIDVKGLSERPANMTLLRRQSWIDIPVVYKSGRRALFTMEKGIPGEKVFDDALKAWTVASAG